MRLDQNFGLGGLNAAIVARRAAAVDIELLHCLGKSGAMCLGVA